ncbi:hypothetical protein F0363_05705 [Orientia tsutsugamushi]|nr:hypothetical protein F0363_05705 [Orientia tsutsugamushi]
MHDFFIFLHYYARYKYKGHFCLPSYSRIIQLWHRMLLPLAVLMHYMKKRRNRYILDLFRNWLR